MGIRLGIFMREKVLPQENQKSSKDGSTSTKVIDFRQQFLDAKSSKISSDPGLEICKDLYIFLWKHLDFPARPHQQSYQLWILMKYGQEALEEHRNVPHYY